MIIYFQILNIKKASRKTKELILSGYFNDIRIISSLKVKKSSNGSE
jgi:hypothetical protein